jgi:Polyketide cyclase / dehydrase and lipid transport
MSATDFHLTTDWHFNAPREAVWQALIGTDEWPSWWRAVKKVERIADGDENGVGAVHRMTWKTALPYTLTFDMRTTRIEPMMHIEGQAEGELSGTGRWGIWPDGRSTRVRYEWFVAVAHPRLALFAPLLRPVFVWNHYVVMGWGFKGLVQKFAAPHTASLSRR